MKSAANKLPSGTTIAADLTTLTDWMKKSGVQSLKLSGSFGDGIGDDYDPQWSVWGEGVPYGSPEAAAIDANKMLVGRVAVGLASHMGSMDRLAASRVELEISSAGALKLEHTSGLGRKTTMTTFSQHLLNTPYKGELLHSAFLDIFYAKVGEKLPSMPERPADDLAVLRDWMEQRGITAANAKISKVFGKWSGDVFFDGHAGYGTFTGFGSRMAALATLALEVSGSTAWTGKNPDEKITLCLTKDRFHVSPIYGQSIEVNEALLSKADFRALRDGRIAGLEIPAFEQEASLAAIIPTYLGTAASPELADRVNIALRNHGIIDAQGYSVVDNMFLDRIDEVIVEPGYEEKIGDELLKGVKLRTVNGTYPAASSSAPERDHEHAFYLPQTAIGPVLLSGNGSRESGYIVRNDLHGGNYLLSRGAGFPDMYSVKGPHQGRQCDAYEVTFRREGGEIQDLKVKGVLLHGSLVYLQENLRLFNKLCEFFAAGLDDDLRVVAKDETAARILGSAKFIAMRTDTDAMATFSQMILNPPKDAKASIEKWLNTGDTRDLYQVRDDLGIENDLKGQNIIGELDASVSYGLRAMKAYRFAAEYKALRSAPKAPNDPQGSQASFDF